MKSWQGGSKYGRGGKDSRGKGGRGGEKGGGRVGIILIKSKIPYLTGKK